MILVALAELRPDVASKVAQRYSIPKTYSSHEEMLKNEKLDGIIASQPFTRHGTLVPELLKSKIPVFTEKPIAGTIEMGEKIVKAVAASGTFQMVGYHKRSDPATMVAKVEIDRLKQTGELGKMKDVRLRMPTGDWVAGGFYDLIGSNATAPQMPWVHAMRQQAINFIAAIKGEIKPLCEAAEALEDMHVARQFLKHYKGV